MKPNLMKFVFLATCLFVLASPGLAQTKATVATAGEDPIMDLPDAPTPATAPAAKSEFRAERAPVAAEQVLDKQFLFQLVPMFGTSVINAELSIRCVKSGACADIPGFLHSRAALYGIGLPADVGIAMLQHSLKRGGHRWWFVPSAIVTAGNVVYAIHAAHYMH